MIGKSERFELRLETETIELVDAWRQRSDGNPSRAEAIRRLIDLGLSLSDTTAHKPVAISDGERLILGLVGELHRHMKVRGESNPDFIQSAIVGGHFWALEWELPGIIHRHSVDDKTVREVVDILDMWSFIEEAFAGFSKADRAKISDRIGPIGKELIFPGFDGNNESTHRSVARFLIEDMGRFERYKGRELNSHHPVIDGYRSMIVAFEPMREKLIGIKLTPAQIVELLLLRR